MNNTSPLPRLTETIIIIHEHTSLQSHECGLDYYEQTAMVSMIRRGQQFLAEVEGSEYLLYQVRTIFDADGIHEASCSCPYDWGGWHKHIVAMLLIYIQAPETIEERPSPAVRWLEKAQAAYQAAGREEEWRDYLEQLIRRHQRKHKLMGMLEILRR